MWSNKNVSKKIDQKNKKCVEGWIWHADVKEALEEKHQIAILAILQILTKFSPQ